MEEHYNAATWLLDRNVDAGCGNNDALVCDGRPIRYEQLLRDVWRAQHALRDLDVRPGERVALIVNDEPAFVAWFLAALRSGVIAVPLSTMLTSDDLATIVDDAEAGIVVVSELYAPHVPHITKLAPSVRTAVVVGAHAADAGVRLHSWSEFDNTTDAPVADTR